MTAFSDEEERQAGLADKAPWLLESRLHELGGKLETAPPWTPHVVTDGNLVTGQNPQSSARTAQELVQSLLAV